MVEMIDTSSDPKPSKPQPQKKKPLSQIQEEEEEEEEDELPRRPASKKKNLDHLQLEESEKEEEDDPREESKNAPKKQKLSMKEAADAAREALKRKREEKAAEKKKQLEQVAQNRARAPNHVAALVKDLNEAADKGPKPVKSCFSAAHREGDMDCFGDLKYLTRNDIKKAMRFTEDDLLFASNLKMLVTRRECTIIAGRKTLTEPVTWLIESNKL